ncbi:MAG: hypothetical protein OEU32_11900 [Acidimicrobiia bacterium]|nr:hypothetical protein [Acidimicrobiia bacterium]
MTRRKTILTLGILMTAVLATALGTAAAVASAGGRSPAVVQAGHALPTTEPGRDVQASERTPPRGPKFIELSYYETFIGVGPPTIEGCQNPEPAVTVCDYTQNGKVNGTHVGQATEIQTGSFRSEPCTNSDATAATALSGEASGTITSQSGDELFFKLTRPKRCGDEWNPPYWSVVGGTGRFTDASGRMSAVARGGPGEGFISVGTLRVRADRYQEFFVHEARSVVPPSATAAQGD